MALVFAGTGTFVFLQFRRSIDTAVDEALRSRADAMLGDAGSLEHRTAAGTSRLVDSDQAFSQLLATDGSVVWPAPPFGQEPVLLRARIATIRAPTFIGTRLVAHGEHFRARLLAVPSGNGSVVVVGAALENRDAAVGRLAGLLWAGGLAALALSAGIGWLLAGAALRPIERMRAEAAAISFAEPGRRLAVHKVEDELARLGRTLNDMLDQLETALERERRFVADASHELRTPLGILRGELELALRGPHVAEELHAAVLSSAEEVDRLCRLSEDLLVLARITDGRFPIRRSPVDVAVLVEETCSAFERKAQEAGVVLERWVSNGSLVELDPVRFRQVLGNLLDNSLRHTPAGGRVSVGAAADGGSLRVDVADTGEGFPTGFFEEVFQPFRRADAARSHHDDHRAGLGLSIVESVVRAHGGSVTVGNRAGGGALVTIDVPAEWRPT